jgi:enoyl-CoA hydratase
MGFYNALQASFSLHQLNHAHWAELHRGGPPAATMEDGAVDWRNAPPVRRAQIDA